jgi:hypothetical protein
LKEKDAQMDSNIHRGGGTLAENEGGIGNAQAEQGNRTFLLWGKQDISKLVRQFWERELTFIISSVIFPKNISYLIKYRISPSPIFNANSISIT